MEFTSSGVDGSVTTVAPRQHHHQAGEQIVVDLSLARVSPDVIGTSRAAAAVCGIHVVVVRILLPA